MSFFSSSSTPPVPAALGPPTKTQLSSLSAVPSGLVKPLLSRAPRRVASKAAPRGRGRRRANKGSRVSPTSLTTSNTRQLSLTVGNDSNLPWYKPLRSNSEITMTLYAAPTALFNSSTTIPVFNSSYFTLADITTSGNYTSVFDQYRIEMVEVLILPGVTENTTASSNTGTLGSAVDFDDANVPSTYAEVSNHDDAIESSGTMSHYHRFSPTYAVATFSGTFTSYSSARGWIDCASPGVQHYGLKYFITPTTSAQSYSFIRRYTVTFRGLH